MPATYRFRTRFAVAAEPALAHGTALRVDEWVAGWPEAIEAALLAPGAPDGTGRRGRAVFRAPLGLYRLTVVVEVTDSDPPRSFSVRTGGDLQGRGRWRFRDACAAGGGVPGAGPSAAPRTRVAFDWCTRLARPWLQRVEPVVRPVLVAAHHRAVRHGVAAYAAALGAGVQSLTSELVD